MGRTEVFGQGEEDVVVLELDSNFNVVWSKVYGGESEDISSDILITRNQEILTLGATRSYGNTTLGGYLQKTTLQGELNWAYQYFPNQSLRLNLLVENPNGGFIISGAKTSGIRLQDKVVGFVNDDGILENAYVYDCDSLLEVGPGFLMTSDGGFMLSAHISGGDGFGGSDLEVIKVSSSGEVEWAKRIGGSGTEIEGESSITGILEIGGGYITYTVTDKTDQASFDAYDLLLLKLNFNGDTVWTKTYGTEFDETIGHRGITRIGDNRILLAVRAARGGEETHEARFIEIDTNGVLLSERMFNPAGREGINTISQTRNGHWGISGRLQAYSDDGVTDEATFIVLPDTGQLCVPDPSFTSFVEDTEFRPFVKDMTCERYLEVDYAEVTPIVEDINVTSELSCVGEIPPLLVGEKKSEETSNVGVACLAGSIELRTFNAEGVVWWTDETEQVELTQKETISVFPTSFDDIIVMAHDEWGRTANFTITVEECRPLIVYELLTPNGDGSNDYFVIDQVPKDAVIELTILNTWGDLLYENSDYDNKWDGGDLLSGNYFYILQVNKQLYKGPLVIRK